MSLADWFYRQMGIEAGAAYPSELSWREKDERLSAILRRGTEKNYGRQPPRLAAVRTAPSRDEFAAWRDDPTTKFVMAALARNAEECKEEWLAKSWGAGNADQLTLTALRERSDALLGFTAHYEAFCETLGLEPQEEGDAA